MPVYFDARWCGRHGIGRFATELLARIPAARPLAIVGPKLSPLDPLAISVALAGKRSGCYFSPGFNPPVRSPLPFIFTIHDLVHLKVPEESTIVRRMYYKTVVLPAAVKAAAILTVSEHSRRDILEWLPISPAKVHVVGNGVSPSFNAEGPSARGKYILHVGRRVGHKNVARLLQAFAATACRNEYRLRFTGTADRDTLASAKEYGIGHRLEFTGDIGDEDLAALYRGAMALVFPSLYEGFGLPVIEAMACGTPVITSASSALAEVSGDGNAILVDPTDALSIADAIDRVSTDEHLRHSLKVRGLVRARAFSWIRVAERVNDVLNRILHGSEKPAR